jgi:hypothetical protein
MDNGKWPMAWRMAHGEKISYRSSQINFNRIMGGIFVVTVSSN